MTDDPSALLFNATDASVGANGATAAQVQQAIDESGLSVNGSGIKVGVLSDSFNDLGGAAADEADGALPSASNIQVLEDLSSGGSDEGRAMMQIIHDIAPGADLAFYTAFNSEQDFANGILALAAAGCKVICDDVSYFDEPFFQNGIIAQAIQTVEAEGVTYISAAGNDASNAYQAAWTPISGSYDGHSLNDAESFGGSIVQTVTVTASSTDPLPLLLEWNQAYGQATDDLEVLVFNNGVLVGSATNASSGEPNNPWVDYNFTSSGTYEIAIEDLSRQNPGLIKEIAAGDGMPVTISGANAGTVFGHAMTPGVIAAGAVATADTPAFGFNPAVSESFSSSGAGTELLFANNGTLLSSADLLSPVVVSGVDDINTTVPGGLSDFFGTSAASASLAGVAALMLSADPSLTPAQVEQIMEDTALPMANSAVSGAGLVQVDPAVADAEALVPAPGGQIIYGGSGNTVVFGGSNDVSIYGGTGNHQIYAGNGSDLVVAGSGNDLIVAGNGRDLLYGGSGNDSIYAGSGNDTLIGGTGTSLLEGGGGHDWLYLSDGNGSEAYGGSGNSAFIAGHGNAVMIGSSTGDDTMYGGPGNDYFYGEGGDDEFFGGAGVDVMIAGANTSSYFDGGSGVNYYFGGNGGGPGSDTGHSTFVLNEQAGLQSYDVVQDWTEGHGVMQFSGTGFTSFNDVLSHSYQNGAYFVIQPDANNAVWLNGATAATLTAADITIVS